MADTYADHFLHRRLLHWSTTAPTLTTRQRLRCIVRSDLGLELECVSDVRMRQAQHPHFLVARLGETGITNSLEQ